MRLASLERSIVRTLLLAPDTIEHNLERIRAAGIVERVPNTWQLSLGVLRMWNRLLFRSDTVGTCRNFPVRRGWRAQLLALRGLRLPFLFAERAITPWDLSGLMSSPEQIIRHLISAHHDGKQFAYDLQILACYGNELHALREQVQAVVARDTDRNRWLRDLVVFERYHENLLEAVDRALESDFALSAADASDPDIAFSAYLAWCAGQSETLAESLGASAANHREADAASC